LEFTDFYIKFDAKRSRFRQEEINISMRAVLVNLGFFVEALQIQVAAEN
jgi:hypothetical protein